MIVSGFIIHHKNPLRKILNRAEDVSKDYKVKFIISKVEDYSWKFEDFEKVHVKFLFPRKFNEFNYVMNFLGKIILRDPIEVGVFDGDLDFGYYVPDELKTSLEDNASFAVFSTKEKFIRGDRGRFCVSEMSMS